MAAHEELFNRLKGADAINALVGTTEDLHLDCKVWPQSDDDAQRMLAKAISGFRNGDGGVIVIGLDARPGPNKDDPDIIRKAVPLADTVLAESRIKNLVGQIVEPLPENIEVVSVPDAQASNSGFVLMHVPPTDGLPCRSRKDWRFYLRVSAGTFPMEYFQIADMFGRRRRPVLRLYLEEAGKGELGGSPGLIHRHFIIGIENYGRGVAKFPSIRFRRSSDFFVNARGLDWRGGFGLPVLPTEDEWKVFGGGADHVIYPGSTLKVARLEQKGQQLRGVVFDAFTFTAELSADEIGSTVETRSIPSAYEPPPPERQ